MSDYLPILYFLQTWVEVFHAHSTCQRNSPRSLSHQYPLKVSSAPQFSSSSGLPRPHHGLLGSPPVGLHTRPCPCHVGLHSEIPSEEVLDLLPPHLLPPCLTLSTFCHKALFPISVILLNAKKSHSHVSTYLLSVPRPPLVCVSSIRTSTLLSWNKA